MIQSREGRFGKRRGFYENQQKSIGQSALAIRVYVLQSCHRDFQESGSRLVKGCELTWNESESREGRRKRENSQADFYSRSCSCGQQGYSSSHQPYCFSAQKWEQRCRLEIHRAKSVRSSVLLAAPPQCKEVLRTSLDEQHERSTPASSTELDVPS